nr:hypothetical protein [Tanacetum cinerariifolium]
MDPDEFEAPQSLKQAPPSPDYVLDPEYPEYLAPSDDEIPIEDLRLPADASPTALSSGYVANSDPLEGDPMEDPEEEPEEDPASEEDEDEEEHLAPMDYGALPDIDPVPLADETEPFEIDESTATPTQPPCTIIPSPPLSIPSPPLPVPSTPLLLPSADCRNDIPEADMPSWKWLCLTALASSLRLGRARQLLPLGRLDIL